MEKPWDIDLQVYDDESELLHGLRQRERMACTCLLKYYAPRLLRLAGQLMGDADEAEDVLQEAFIRACDRIDSFRGESGLGTWLHRIVINTALMRLRARKSVTTDDIEGVIADGPESNWQSVSSGARDPGQQVLGAELFDRMSAAIERLPESLRIAFVLRDIEGMSTHDAAATLGISESALKVRLHRARLALRKDLAGYVDAAPPKGTGSQ
ncbi:MAG: sigma-70 family RNA polymerase sigma factor [Sphaerobacteraceae bacterium]|nr:MAG: sigma-70 family RNA polymerase sigma factor [Sphaerobacteraceae bacterium]